MNGLFKDLEDEDHFVAFVSEKFEEVPGQIRSVMWCQPVIDRARVEYAHSQYMQNLEGFKLYLHSKNPDHYKRAGALLHALYRADCVTELNLEASSDDLEAGFTRVTMGDAEHVLHFVRFYEEYFNQLLAFHVSYKCCAGYEADPVTFDFDYLQNICRYLGSNQNLSMDSLFMLFKSLMLKS